MVAIPVYAAAMATDKEKEKFTKTDMERVALFQEMGYVTIGDKYKAVDSSMFHFSIICTFTS